MLPQIEPVFGDQEVEAVTEYMKTYPWLTEYARTQELERTLELFLGVEHCIMVPNGTLALYAAYRALGVRQGVEVIVPAFTMLATANAAIMLGATIRFVDIDPKTLCLDLNMLDAMNWPTCSHFGIVAAVDLNGRAPDMERLRDIATRHNAIVLEDAAQAFGSQQGGKYLGTLGRAGIFSFSPHKIISAGQGGCVVTNNNFVASEVRGFKNFGRVAGGDRHAHYSYGINLKYTDLQAVVLLEQLKRIDARLRIKQDIRHMYEDRLEDVDGIELIPMFMGGGAVPWYVDVLTDERAKLMEFLRKNDIQTQRFYPAVPNCPPYAALNAGYFPVARSVSRRGLWLPSSVNLTEGDIDNVCAQIRRFYGSAPG